MLSGLNVTLEFAMINQLCSSMKTLMLDGPSASSHLSIFHAKEPYLFLNSHVYVVCLNTCGCLELPLCIFEALQFLFVLLSQSLTNFSEPIYQKCPGITCLCLLCDVIAGDLSLWHFCDFYNCTVLGTKSKALSVVGTLNWALSPVPKRD